MTDPTVTSSPPAAAAVGNAISEASYNHGRGVLLRQPLDVPSDRLVRFSGVSHPWNGQPRPTHTVFWCVRRGLPFPRTANPAVRTPCSGARVGSALLHPPCRKCALAPVVCADWCRVSLRYGSRRPRRRHRHRNHCRMSGGCARCGLTVRAPLCTLLCPCQVSPFVSAPLPGDQGAPTDRCLLTVLPVVTGCKSRRLAPLRPTGHRGPLVPK